jgi:cytochrome c
MAWKLSLTALAVAAGLAAQGPKYGLGRAVGEDEAAKIGVATTPDGAGLPRGQGTAVEGAEVYKLRCEECHGPEGKGGDEVALVGRPDELLGPTPKKTVGSYWPYATTIWDYINRAMPFKQPGMLTDDQVYAVTAYILHLNGLVSESDTVDAAALSKIVMPNRDGFIRDPRSGQK